MAWCPPNKTRSATATTEEGKGRRPGDIQKTVRQKYRELRSCYNAALSRNGLANGRVVTRFAIQQDGTVTQACIAEATLDDNKALACMLEAFTTIRFPPADGLVTVVYPIEYSPGF